MQDELTLEQAAEEISDIILDEVDVSVDEDVVDIRSEVVQHSVDAEETEVIEIDVSEGFTGNTGLNVAADHSRYLPDQHTIGAITGLREELDEIERLKDVCSDNRNQANYYLWEDENPSKENRDGYFVSIRKDDNRIRICTAEEDEFGVTVSSAGFIGGQEDIIRGNAYGLVVHSGIAPVRCETDVEAGDYVVSDDYGVARKTDGTYGYLATAISNIDGVTYAIVSLTTPSTQMQKFSAAAKDVSNRMENAEVNIATAISVANAAYNKAKLAEVSVSNNNESVGNQIESVLGKVEDMEGQIEIFGNTLESASQIASQAYGISQTASTTAENIRQEAVKAANDAQASVNDLISDLAPVITWVDPESGNTGAEYLVNHMNNNLATKTEVSAVETLTENNSTAISKNAENIELLATSIDKYSVGEYSQAYGLTWEQAKSILKNDMLYIPTVEHDEMYEGYPTSDHKQEFTRGYYYIWNGSHWVESIAPLVYFSAEPVKPSSQCEYWYRETNEDLEIQNNVTGDIEFYEAHSLYVLMNDKWVKVNILEGNVTNRVVSAIKQSADKIALDVVNARNDIAALEAKIDDGGATMSMIASVVTALKDENGNPIDITGGIYSRKEDIPFFNAGEYYAVGESKPYDIYTGINGELVKVNYLYYDGVNIMQPNTASIVNAVNHDGDSSIALNADKINFDGVAIFTKDNAGITTITGGVIQSGYIASHNVSGTATTEEGIISGQTVSIHRYDITQGILFDLSQGSIHTKNFTLDAYGNVSVRGHLEATSGWIGDSVQGIKIRNMGLYYADGTYESSEKIKMMIDPTCIQVGAKKSGEPYTVLNYDGSFYTNGTAGFAGTTNFYGTVNFGNAVVNGLNNTAVFG